MPFNIPSTTDGDFHNSAVYGHHIISFAFAYDEFSKILRNVCYFAVLKNSHQNDDFRVVQVKNHSTWTKDKLINPFSPHNISVDKLI